MSKPIDLADSDQFMRDVVVKELPHIIETWKDSDGKLDIFYLLALHLAVNYHPAMQDSNPKNRPPKGEGQKDRDATRILARVAQEMHDADKGVMDALFDLSISNSAFTRAKRIPGKAKLWKALKEKPQAAQSVLDLCDLDSFWKEAGYTKT